MSRKGTADAANISVIKDVDMAAGYDMPGVPVNIKNNNAENVTLRVHPIDNNAGELVTTLFTPGWNPEIVDYIEADSSVQNIQVGM